MAYDEGMAERIRELLPKAAEKKMFGGIGWMERGNMVAGIMGGGDGDTLMVRCPPDETEAFLKRKGAFAFKQGPRPMKGWILVAGDAVAEDEDLKKWVEESRKFVATLPAK